VATPAPDRVPLSDTCEPVSRYGVDTDGASNRSVPREQSARGNGRLPEPVGVDRHRVHRGVGEVPAVLGEREREPAPGGVDATGRAGVASEITERRHGVHPAVFGRSRHGDHERGRPVDPLGHRIGIGAVGVERSGS